MGMDHCDDDMIIAFVFYLLAEEKKKNKHIGFIVFKAREEKKNFPLCLDIDDRQKFFVFF
jgi:hypothetical protein